MAKRHRRHTQLRRIGNCRCSSIGTCFHLSAAAAVFFLQFPKCCVTSTTVVWCSCHAHHTRSRMHFSSVGRTKGKPKLTISTSVEWRYAVFLRRWFPPGQRRSSSQRTHNRAPVSLQCRKTYIYTRVGQDFIIGTWGACIRFLWLKKKWTEKQNVIWMDTKWLRRDEQHWRHLKWCWLTPDECESVSQWRIWCLFDCWLAQLRVRFDCGSPRSHKPHTLRIKKS